MLNFINTVDVDRNVLDIITLLKCGVKSGNSIWAESHGMKDYVSDLCRKLISEKRLDNVNRLLSQLLLKLEHVDYEGIYHFTSCRSDLATLNPTEKSLLQTMIGERLPRDTSYGFSGWCKILLKHISQINKNFPEILDKIQEDL